MADSDHIVAETAARIFADLADPQTVNRPKDERWKEPLWRALEEAGLTLAWVPEAARRLGRKLSRTALPFSAPPDGCAIGVPLAETLLAGWLLARAGLQAPDGRDDRRAGAAA